MAEDIPFARARDADPLRPWPRTALFPALYRRAPHWRLPMEAWRAFAWLAGRFPQARYILSLRRPKDWIGDRLARDGGAEARCHAHHRGCGMADLPGLWDAEWRDHLARVAVFFGADPRLIRVDLDRETPGDLAARLAHLVPMGTPAVNPAGPRHRRRGTGRRFGPARNASMPIVSRMWRASVCAAWRGAGPGTAGCRNIFPPRTARQAWPTSTAIRAG